MLVATKLFALYNHQPHIHMKSHILPEYGSDQELQLSNLGNIQLSNNNSMPLRIRKGYYAEVHLHERELEKDFTATVKFFDNDDAEIGTLEFESYFEFTSNPTGYQFPNMSPHLYSQYTKSQFLVELMKASGAELEIDIGEKTLHLISKVIDCAELELTIPEKLFNLLLR